MNIFILEQLITKEKNILLSQQQVRMIRGSKERGYKLKQFKTLEDKVIKQSIIRKVKEEYQVTASNRSTITCKKVKISQDK